MQPRARALETLERKAANENAALLPNSTTPQLPKPYSNSLMEEEKEAAVRIRSGKEETVAVTPTGGRLCEAHVHLPWTR